VKQSMAKALAEVVKAAAKDERGVVKPRGSEVEIRLLSMRLPNISEASAAAYHSDVRGYVEFVKEKALSPGDVSTLIAYRKHLLRKGLRPSSVNRKLIAVKRYLIEFAKREYTSAKAEVLRGVYRDVMAVKLGAGEKHISRDKLITEEEARRLLDAMPRRIRYIGEFLFVTGARISEALNVKLSDVRSLNGYAEVMIVGKAQKARRLLISTEFLERCRDCYAGERYLFSTRSGSRFDRSYVLREFVRASKRALGKRVTPHCARHSFATWTLSKTRKIKGVSEYLGHSDAAVTLNMYIHETLTAEELLGDAAEPRGTRKQP